MICVSWWDTRFRFFSEHVDLHIGFKILVVIIGDLWRYANHGTGLSKATEAGCRGRIAVHIRLRFDIKLHQRNKSRRLTLAEAIYVTL